MRAKAQSGTMSRARRDFFVRAGQGTAAAAVIDSLVQISPLHAQGVAKSIEGASAGAQSDTAVKLPPFEAETEQQSGPPPLPVPPDRRVGFAVVGLGRLAVEQLLPAFAQTKYAKLAALVSGSPDKARELAHRYGVSNVYSYDSYDRLSDNSDVQVVYIVLPNGLHAEYTVRAARAGKHVLCEKPMANSVAEAEQMIAACKQAGRLLMIAYRIQYEPYNRLIRSLVRQQTYGVVKLIEAVNVQRQGEPDQWRHKRALAGGGALPDIGLYCLNTTRFLLGEEPQEVYAMIYSTPGDARFREVEENMAFQLRFPSGVLANSMTGYDAHNSKRYRVYATRAWYGMDPAFTYENLAMELDHARGAVTLTQQPKLAPRNQFALEIDHMAECVRTQRTPFTPGEEGLQDHRIMAALYESAQSGRPIKLPTAEQLDSFRGTEPSA